MKTINLIDSVMLDTVSSSEAITSSFTYAIVSRVRPIA